LTPVSVVGLSDSVFSLSLGGVCVSYIAVYPVSVCFYFICLEIAYDRVWLCLFWDVQAKRSQDMGLMCSLQDHSCAVHRGGTVSCWGSNAHGQAHRVPLFYVCFLCFMIW
jgi:hypothetical protein